MIQNKQFTLIKKIAKRGSQAIIVIPKLIEDSLKPGTIVEIRIDVIENISKTSVANA